MKLSSIFRRSLGYFLSVLLLLHAAPSSNCPRDKRASETSYMLGQFIQLLTDLVSYNPATCPENNSTVSSKTRDSDKCYLLHLIDDVMKETHKRNCVICSKKHDMEGSCSSGTDNGLSKNSIITKNPKMKIERSTENSVEWHGTTKEGDRYVSTIQDQIAYTRLENTKYIESKESPVNKKNWDSEEVNATNGTGIVTEESSTVTIQDYTTHKRGESEGLPRTYNYRSTEGTSSGKKEVTELLVTVAGPDEDQEGVTVRTEFEEGTRPVVDQNNLTDPTINNDSLSERQYEEELVVSSTAMNESTMNSNEEGASDEYFMTRNDESYITTARSLILMDLKNPSNEQKEGKSVTPVPNTKEYFTDGSNELVTPIKNNETLSEKSSRQNVTAEQDISHFSSEELMTTPISEAAAGGRHDEASDKGLFTTYETAGQPTSEIENQATQNIVKQVVVENNSIADTTVTEDDSTQTSTTEKADKNRATEGDLEEGKPTSTTRYNIVLNEKFHPTYGYTSAEEIRSEKQHPTVQKKVIEVLITETGPSEHTDEEIVSDSSEDLSNKVAATQEEGTTTAVSEREESTVTDQNRTSDLIIGKGSLSGTEEEEQQTALNEELPATYNNKSTEKTPNGKRDPAVQKNVTKVLVKVTGPGEYTIIKEEEKEPNTGGVSVSQYGSTNELFTIQSESATVETMRVSSEGKEYEAYEISKSGKDAAITGRKTGHLVDREAQSTKKKPSIQKEYYSEQKRETDSSDTIAIENTEGATKESLIYTAEPGTEREEYSMRKSNLIAENTTDGDEVQ